MGYNLTIVKKNVEPNKAIEEFVFSKVKTANCISRVAAEVSFQLPLAEMPNFKELFIGLDENLHELKIASYGISITTLEEVFLKVAEGSDPTKHNLKFTKEDPDQDAIDDFDLNSVKIKGKCALFFIHFWAIFIKRLQYLKRDKKGLICEILMPCAIVGVGLCISFITFLNEAPPLKMSPELLPLPVKLPVQEPYLNSYYKSANFPGNYFTYLTSNTINNFDIASFDQFIFEKRNIDEKGLYGSYFINPNQGNKFSYLAFVEFF